MNICFEREKNKKKRNKHGYWKNWYDRFVRQIFDNVEANTCQCQWATGTDRMFKTMAWNKERQRECCNKIWSPKTYVAVENECKKAREKFNHNFFLAKPLQRKVSYLLICYNHTSIYSPKFCKLLKHCMKGSMS